MDEREQRLLRLKQRKKKRILVAVLLVLLVGGLIGGYFLAVELREKKETKKADEEQRKQLEAVQESYQINDYTFYNVASIDYTNQENTYCIYKVVTDNGNVWKRKGFDDFKIKSDKVLFIIATFCRTEGTKRIPAAEADLAEYGLDDSKMRATLTMDDGVTLSYRFGDKAPYNEGYYFLDEASGDVYIVNADYYQEFCTTEIEMVAPEDFPEVPKENMKRITVTKKGEEPVTYLPQKAGDGTPYYDSIFMACESIVASTVKEWKCKDFSVYGLDEPEVVLTVEYTEETTDAEGNVNVDEKTMTVDFGAETESGNRYIRVNGSAYVYIMTNAYAQKYMK